MRLEIVGRVAERHQRLGLLGLKGEIALPHPVHRPAARQGALHQLKAGPAQLALDLGQPRRAGKGLFPAGRSLGLGPLFPAGEGGRSRLIGFLCICHVKNLAL